LIQATSLCVQWFDEEIQRTTNQLFFAASENRGTTDGAFDKRAPANRSRIAEIT